MRRQKALRFRIVPRDVPSDAVARRLGKSATDFDALSPNLIARGFPKPDPDTGNFDLVAVDKWCDARHAHLFGGLKCRHATPGPSRRIE